MNGQAIISKFELYVDDATELSSTEELALMNEKARDIYADRPWEFLKKPASGTLSISVPYVSLPADFDYMVANANYTENFAADDFGQTPIVVFVGTSYRPVRVVNWSDRRQYRDRSDIAFLDLPNFAKQPTSAEAYEFDYIHQPADIALNAEPLFPVQFQPLLYLAMAIDDDIIQRFEKARSYAGENAAKYQAMFRRMALWNAQFSMN
jgi:hypothetical protein